MDPKVKKYIESEYRRVKAIDQGAPTEDWLLNFCHQALTAGKGASYTKALELLFALARGGQLDLQTQWHIYWILTRESLLKLDTQLKMGGLDELYDTISRRYEAEIGRHLDLSAPVGEPTRQIVVLTSQFLTLGHAPTRRVLDYSHALQKDLGLPVFIINDALTAFVKTPALEPSYAFNHLPAYNEVSSLTYKGEAFAFKQVPAQIMPNVQVGVALVQKIREINPLMIYNIGASSLIADVCSRFVQTASLPCSFEIPNTRTRFVLVGRPIGPGDADRLNRLSRDQVLIETDINYVPDASDHVYSRSELGLGDNAFVVCLVGNRLELEISADLLKLLHDLLALNPSVELLFIGPFGQDSAIRAALEPTGRVRFAGSIDHADKAIKVADLYLNPMRSGGGRSVFEALSAAVPVITLPVGDGFHTAGQAFVASDWAEMLALARRYIEDDGHRHEMKTKAVQRANQLANVAQTQKAVLEKIISPSALPPGPP